MEVFIKQELDSEYRQERYLQYEVKGAKFRPSERVLFKKVSSELKYFLDIHVKPHPTPEHELEWMVEIIR